VSAKLKYWIALATLIGFQHPLITSYAFAATAEVAKKCNALTDKAYPLRVPGNPAAGRTHGTPQEIQNYFKTCVANGGNI
jgi:hypothetical protein